jgi:mannose-1-phosphate guanylyltransferase
VESRVAAAVLCGGRGERLRPLTDFFQKTMVPVGPSKRPLLEYIVHLLSFHGVADIALLTGYRTSEIREYFGDGSNFGVRIRYSEDRKDGPKGSLNAVANALNGGVLDGHELLLIYYGDVLSDLDITELVRFHLNQSADATLVLANGYPLPVGIVDVKRNRITAVREKPTLELNVMTGCMLVGRKAMNLMKKVASVQKTDLMTHFVPELLARRHNVAAYYLKGRWYDVGTVTSFENLNQELKAWKLPFADLVETKSA